MQRFKVTLNLSDVYVVSDKPIDELATELTELAERFLYDFRLHVFHCDRHPDSIQLDVEEVET
jgi:hypothetical protein